MANWEAWYDEVLPDVPGCPQNVAKNAIRNAAIEFCERTYVYVVDHPAIDVVADVGAYAWSPAADLKVVRPDSVWFQGSPLDPVTRSDLSDMYTDWTAAKGTPRYFVQERVDQLILVPKPVATVTGAVTAKVSVAPSRASTSIPDFLWERYLEDIAAGAKGRLMAMAGKPYTNPQMAAVQAQAFDDAVGAVNLKAFRGHGRARINSRLGRRRFL